MSYSAAVEQLYAKGQELATSPGVPRRKFTLEQMRVLASGLNDPQTTFPSLLVAGTNGKGSVCSMVASILRAAGYRAGLYTSPHLVRVNERMQVDGHEISDEDFARLYFEVEEAAKRLVAEGHLPLHPSFFETLTAIAFLYFAERKVDIAVLEVGMGGRLDATNIVEPLVSVIADIALDHQEWLGNTIRKIAQEKAGILRQGGVLITLPQHPEANQAIGEVASALNVRGVNAAEYMPRHGVSGWYEPYIVMIGKDLVEIAPPLAGTHQHRNIALAIAAVAELRNAGFSIPAQAVSAGIAATSWPGRLEQLRMADGKVFLLDVAHNPAGAWALRSALSALGGAAGWTLIFACLADKALTEMAQILFPLFDHVVLTPVHSPRSTPVEALRAVAEQYPGTKVVNTPAEALAPEMLDTEGAKCFVISGSVYLVGEARALLTSRGAVPERRARERTSEFRDAKPVEVA